MFFYKSIDLQINLEPFLSISRGSRMKIYKIIEVLGKTLEFFNVPLLIFCKQGQH